MFICGLSGEIPQDPVVTKSGTLYERRLIVKYITENGTDPLDGSKLAEEDLIPLKTNPKAAPPRTPSATSIPALLTLLQNEWDANALASFAQHQEVRSLRQQLSHALYSQDAATRVLARVIKERDAAREALANVHGSLGLSGPAPVSTDVEMEEVVPEEPAGLPQPIIDQIEAKSAQLSASRKKRSNPKGQVKADQVKSYSSVLTIPSLHASSPSNSVGINTLVHSSKDSGVFVTGGNDRIVQVYDKGKDKVLASLKGHSKRVTHIALREAENESTLLISGSDDKTARVWRRGDSDSEDTHNYELSHTISTHKGEISGLALHPTNNLLAVASRDGTYSLHDLASDTFTSVFRSKPFDGTAFTSAAIHPDGTLLAIGTPTSTIHIFDIRTGSLAGTLAPAEGDAASSTPFTVSSISCSENGYHLLAPYGSAQSTVAIWDLRKQATAHTINLGEGFGVRQVAYDKGALFFGVAGAGGARVFAHKSWDQILSLGDDDFSHISFSSLGKEVWGVSGREVRIWGPES